MGARAGEVKGAAAWVGLGKVGAAGEALARVAEEMVVGREVVESAVAGLVAAGRAGLEVKEQGAQAVVGMAAGVMEGVGAKDWVAREEVVQGGQVEVDMAVEVMVVAGMEVVEVRGG